MLREQFFLSKLQPLQYWSSGMEGIWSLHWVKCSASNGSNQVNSRCLSLPAKPAESRPVKDGQVLPRAQVIKQICGDEAQPGQARSPKKWNRIRSSGDDWGQPRNHWWICSDKEGPKWSQELSLDWCILWARSMGWYVCCFSLEGKTNPGSQSL